MTLPRRAYAGLLAALLFAAPAAHAQDNATVGSPLLRDFELKGERTTPPAAEQPATPPPAAPPPRETPAASPPAARPQPAPSARSQPENPSSRTQERAQPASEAPPAAVNQADPVASAVAEPEMTFPDPAETGPAAAEAPAPQPEEDSSGLPWLAIAAAAVLGLAALAFLRRRRRDGAGTEAQEAAAEPAPAPVPVVVSPVPAAATVRSRPVLDGALQVDLRPWLDIEFTPERLVLTETEATVFFGLLIKNRGRSAARNVRILARMFNPSPDQKQEISAFFASSAAMPAQPINIPPQVGGRFNSKVVLPRADVREVQVQGRSIFVPTVAINVVYDYGVGRTGQTSNCYVIGTETEASEKMGPFRLDLGPRIYRQVGGRSLDLARAV